MLGNEVMLFELRDILGNVKEMVYSILIWPILYLMRAEYTKLTRAFARYIFNVESFSARLLVNTSCPSIISINHLRLRFAAKKCL